MVAVIPFTCGAHTVVEGCLDVRGPRLPLPGGGEACAVVLEGTMMLREILWETPRLACLVPPRGTPLREGLELMDLLIKNLSC